MISAFGDKQGLEMEEIKQLYQCLEKGYNSMPLDLPGTPFRRAMKVVESMKHYLILILFQEKKDY